MKQKKREKEDRYFDFFLSFFLLFCFCGRLIPVVDTQGCYLSALVLEVALKHKAELGPQTSRPIIDSFKS